MQRVKISLLCLLSLSLAGVLAAQTAVDPNSDVGSASLQDFSGGATFSGTYFDVRHMSGDGVGYKNGYTQIGAFAPYWLGEDAFIAPNARILLTDNSDIGLNAGLVARRYDSDRDRIWGINAYFDTDVTKFGNRYNQLGLGVESLGQFFDFRANAYAPTGEDTTFIRPVGLSNVPYFFENRIGFLGTRLMEQALSGGDFEAGVPVTPQTPWLRAFAGAYAYQQNLGADPVGVRARLEAWVSNDLSLGVTTTWDRQFGTNVNFVADWRFSGFMPTRYFPQWTTRERMLMPVQRQSRITAGNYLEDVNILAFNPRDNQPYFVVWVDNSSGGTNAGTFENPYNSLNPSPAIPNETDLVLVRRGNTTELAPLNGSITLPDYARMLGEGKAHIFDAYGDFGPLHVAIDDQVLPDPAFTNPVNANNYPFLTNTDAGLNGGDIIRVGSHNEVSALVLEGATGRGIFGNNVGGFNFNNLEITNNIGGGIRLQDAFGSGMVTLDGQVINGGVIRDINVNPVNGWSYAGTGLGDNAAGGIYVDTRAPGLNLDITNVAMNSNPGAQLFGINLQADDGALVTTFTNVQTNGFGPGAGNTVAGIILGEFNQALTATLTNVSASNNTGDGLQVTGTNGSILATITDSGSVFNDNGGSGIVYSQTGGIGTLDMTNIQANSNGVDGLGLFGSAGTVMNVNVHNSFLNFNTRDGIHVEEVGGATVNLLVDPTEVTFNGRDGLFFRVDGASTLNATFIDTNLSDNVRHGIRGIVTAGSIVNLSLTDSPVDRSGQDGFFFDVDASELRTTAVRSSFSNSGQTGPSGNGIVGNVTTAGLATFDFTSTPVINNLDSGLHVRTSGLSNFQGAFANSPFDDNGNTTAGNGIRLDLDNSPASSLDLTGGLTTLNRNGNNGFELNASNGTVFTSTFDGTQIVDNGQDLLGLGRDGVQVNVDLVPGADSTVTQIFTNVTITNTLLPGTQMDGYDFSVGNGGDLTAFFQFGSLSDNFENATDGSVTGAGSTATVSLDVVAANRSGGSGALLRVETGGELNFSATNGTSLSNGARGVNVFVLDPFSVANLELDQVLLDVNVAEGFRGIAQNQGTLNACIRQTSLRGNGSNGISLSIQGAGAGLPSTGNFHVENSLVDNNLGGGLLAGATDGGQLNYRSVDTSYNNNGLSGVFDGVQVSADGAGTRVLTLFTTDPLALVNNNTSNNNTDDGFEFNATNGAALTASLDNVTATGNTGFGVNFNASGAGTNAHLLLTGTNQFTGNGAGAFNINVGAINQVVLQINGSYDNSAGDGIFIDLNGVNNAVVAIQGPGTIDNSGQAPFPGPSGNGDGIDIRMTNITNGTILIEALTSINTSAADGIHIEMDSVLNGAIRIDGTTPSGTNTVIGGSGDDGIDISLVNTNLVDNLDTTFGTTPIDLLTLTDTLPVPLNNCLPQPVTRDLNTLGLVPALALTINSVTLSGNAGQGINIHSPIVSNSTIATATFSDNVIVNSAGGDGMHFGLFNTPITTLNITGNEIGNSRDNGVNFDLDNSPVATVNISNNSIGAITGGGGGTALEDLLPVILPGFNAFTLLANDDQSTGLVPLGFNANFFGTTYTDTFVNNNGNITFTGPLFTFTPFSLLTTATPIIAPFFADVDTRAGNEVTYGPGIVGGRPAFGVNWIDVRHFSAAGGGPNGLPTNRFQLILVDRSDVAPGDFDFEFNYEEIQWEAGQASGGDPAGLGGSSARAGYSNGIATSLELPGSAINGAFLDSGPALTSLIQNSLNSIHPGRYIFFARGGGIGGGGSPNGNDGILLNAQNGSNIGAMTIDSNTIVNNGQHGIEIQLNNSTLPGPGAPVIISNNTITDQVGGDGFRMINPNTGGSPIGLTFQDNTISTNGVTSLTGGVGINVQLNNAEVASVVIESVATGNQISNNGSFGVHLVGANTSQIDLTMLGAPGAAPNTLEANGDAGIGIELRDNATMGILDVSQTVITGTLVGANDLNFNGEGLGIHLTDAALINGAVIGDAALLNTNFNANASHGIDVEVGAFAQWTNSLVQNVTANGNTGDGLHMQRGGNGSITGATITDSFFTANSDGIDISAQFALTDDDYTFTNNFINGNAVNGMRLSAQADARINTILTDNVITNNGDNGILITTTLISPGDAAEVFSGLGAWTGNTISNNGQTTGAAGAGIQISGIHTIDLGTLASGNIINTNAGDGIEINASGTLNVVNATIRFNGTSGSADGLAGIDLNSLGVNFLTVSNSVISNNLGDGFEIDNTGFFTFVSLTDNLIQFNSRDGVEYMDRGTGINGLSISGTAVLANQITDNGFRGIDIVVAGSNPASSVSIDNTDVLRNGQEGINVILSSDVNQTTAAFRDNVSSAALAANGAIGSTPFLDLSLTNNRINQNGQVAGNIGGSGIILRVGTTSRATSNFTDPGGFASGANGGVNATMTGNSLTGNFGADVLFESFTSTVNPATTGGTWTDQNENPRDPTDDTFGPGGYQTDPLARLDLVFNSNVGDELDATRQGAFYNNDESIFKSRTQGQDNGTDGGPFDDPGPFGSGTRQRNAQRLAARDVNIGGTQLPPSLSTGASNAFLYPGMGQSTFRVNTTGGNIFGLPLATSDFLLDGNPYIDFTDANGNPLTAPNGGPLGIDNMPWGWSDLP